MWVGMSRREREARQMWTTVILSLVCLAVQTVPDWGPQVTVREYFCPRPGGFQCFERQYYLGQNLQVCWGVRVCFVCVVIVR